MRFRIMKFKKLTAIILCFVMCALLCPMVSAAPTTKVTLSNDAAFPGEEATVDVMITGNPGIMSMTFSITYDKDCFEFVSFNKGFVTNPTYKNHSDKGYVAFSISETSDKSNSGNILSVTFKVKKNTTPDTYPITIANVNPVKYGNDLNNCFVNSSEDSIIPTVTAGSIRIKGECDASGHKFGDWTETKPANCTETGLEERVCSVCQEIEEKKTPLKHDFEDEWTVDQPATPEKDGTMSRHCKLCDVVTDELKFSYEEIGGGDEDDDITSSTPSSTTSSSTESNVSSTTSNTSSSTTPSTPSGTTSNTTSNNTTTSNDSTTSTNEPTVNKPTQKPNINNQPGEKVPQSEVEKLEDYENVKPPVEDETEDEDKNVIEDNVSDKKDSSNKQVSANGDQDEDETFFSTPIGIITAVISILISLGIIALAILLILKKRKSE